MPGTDTARVPPLRRFGAAGPGARRAGRGRAGQGIGTGPGSIRALDLARGRAEPPGPLRPQAEGAGRVSRAVRHDRHPDARPPVHGARAQTGGAERSVRAGPLERQLRRRTSRGRLDRADRGGGCVAVEDLSAQFRLDRGPPPRHGRLAAVHLAGQGTRPRRRWRAPWLRRRDLGPGLSPVPDRLLRGRRAQYPQPATGRRADSGTIGRPSGRPPGARPRPPYRRCRSALPDRDARRTWDHLHGKAHALLSSPATHAALDLSREPAAIREAYGRTSFGQSCLLGRRLVEAGVPYVQVNWSQYVEVFYPFSDYGWDTHADNFGLLADWHGPLLDRVLSTLLDDLGRAGCWRRRSWSAWASSAGRRGSTPSARATTGPSAISRSGPAPGCRPAGSSARATPAASTPPPTRSRRPWSAPPCWNRVGISSAERAELRVLQGGRVIDELF